MEDIKIIEQTLKNCCQDVKHEDCLDITKRNKATMGKKAIGLIRVSTAVQDLVQQSDAVKAEMLKDGYSEENIILIEDKESAVKLSEEERNGLVKMKQFIESDKDIECVYVFEISRISRRPKVLYSIRDYLIEHNVQLIVLKPYMKLLDGGSVSQTANMLFSIFGALAEQEGYLRKERTSRGKAKKQAEGKSLGNWLPLGYTTDDEKHIIIDEPKAELVRKIFKLCLYDNYSSARIARELSESGEWKIKNTLKIHASSIRNVLHNTAYIGIAPYNKKRQKENHNIYPRIIDDELFYSVQDILSKRKYLPKTKSKNVYFCKGLIRDDNSGVLLSATPSVASYMFCSDRADIIKYKTVTVPINLFDSFAWHLTQVYLSNTDTRKMKEFKKELEKRQAELKKKIDTLSDKAEEYRRQEERIQSRIISGKLSESLGDKMLEEVYSNIKDTFERMNEYSREHHLNTYQLHRYDTGQIKKENLLITSDSDKYNLIHEVIKEILVTKGGVPEVGRIRSRGLGVKYGRMKVLYENGLSEEYKFNSYTKKVYTLDDVEVEYEYTKRIKGSQIRTKKKEG